MLLIYPIAYLLLNGYTWHEDSDTAARPLSGMLFYFFGFWAPIILQLSAKSTYFFLRGFTQQPRQDFTRSNVCMMLSWLWNAGACVGSSGVLMTTTVLCIGSILGRPFFGSSRDV